MVKRNNFASMVGIARFENQYIEEWINFHRLIGFDHFYIYDNSLEGEENLDFLLENYSDCVTITKMAGKYKQGAAYQHYIDNFSRYSDWAAFLDIDEFLVLREDRTLENFLNKYGHLNSIGLNWLSFGHNGHEKRPDGLTLDRFAWRYPVALSEIKTLCRSQTLKAVHSIHNVDGFARLLNGFAMEGGGKIAHSGSAHYTPALDFTSLASVNHYFTRSLEDLEIKAARGSAAGTVVGRRNFDWYTKASHAFNWTLDIAAPQLVRTLINGSLNAKNDFYKKKHLSSIWQIPAPLDFDPQWYVDFYPDLAHKGLSAQEAVRHFCSLGAHQGRSWSPLRWEGKFFDATSYLLSNPDLFKSGLSPELALYHYLVDGQIKGRKIF